MLAIFGSLASGLFKNPLILVGVAVVAFGVSAWSSIKSKMDEQAAIAPWADAVAERDRASQIKDDTLTEIVRQKEAQDAARKQLEKKLADAEKEAASKVGSPYYWNDNERRLLNDVNKGSYLDTAKRLLSPGRGNTE